MSVEGRPVRTRRELNTFIKLPWRIYRNEPKWVAPLLMDVKKRLDQDKNPFFKHAQAQYFLAYRDGQLVGRVSAHVDQNFNEFQGNDWGLFGWFECEDDPPFCRRSNPGLPGGRGFGVSWGAGACPAASGGSAGCLKAAHRVVKPRK
jgi:hypothetical protein